MFEVERHTRLIPHYPSIVTWLHLKSFSRSHGDFYTLAPSNSHVARENVSDMSVGSFLACLYSHVDRPSPSRKVFPTANSHGLQNYNRPLAAVEKRARFVSIIEIFHQRIH